MINKKHIQMILAVILLGASFLAVQATSDDEPLDIAKQFEANGKYYDFNGDGDVDRSDTVILLLITNDPKGRAYRSHIPNIILQGIV